MAKQVAWGPCYCRATRLWDTDKTGLWHVAELAGGRDSALGRGGGGVGGGSGLPRGQIPNSSTAVAIPSNKD